MQFIKWEIKPLPNSLLRQIPNSIWLWKRGKSRNVNEALEHASKIWLPGHFKSCCRRWRKRNENCRTPGQMEKMFILASKESAKAFNDPSLFIEKYIKNPKHIEFQIFADKIGNIIHLGERECSIQRKHQKLIEESPSLP